jgi:hypothetical protein
MTESRSVIEEYAHGCQIVEEDRDGDYNHYHYQWPMGRIKSFENPDKARLYADVQTVTDGFREEKTGERGAPPAVAQSREDVLMAYYASMPTMSIQWVAAQFDLPEDRVREYIQSLQNRAEQIRADQDAETD